MGKEPLAGLSIIGAMEPMTVPVVLDERTVIEARRCQPEAGTSAPVVM